MNSTNQSPEGMKRLAADRVIDTLRSTLHTDSVIGVGTGSTVNCFISELTTIRHHFRATVSSSIATTKQLEQLNIPVLDAHQLQSVDVYVDGADEVDPTFALIKGGGGALTQEKIVTSMARRFICIVDETKLVQKLGKFPVPIEVIPSARTVVARKLQSFGGEVVLRDGLTDNHNRILDVHGLEIDEPDVLEQQVASLAGVVTVGIFALNRPDEVVVAYQDGKVEWRTKPVD